MPPSCTSIRKRPLSAFTPGPTTRPSLLFDKLTVEQIEEAIAALSDEYRVVATLYFLEEFSYQEIAEVVEVPVGTVRSRLHRARHMLQKALWTIAKERGIVSALAGSTGEGD